MDYIYYRFRKIFMAHGEWKAEVELESLCNTRVGGLQWWKPLKMAEDCFCNCQLRGRGVAGDEGGIRGWGDFTDDKSFKMAGKCP